MLRYVPCGYQFHGFAPRSPPPKEITPMIRCKFTIRVCGRRESVPSEKENAISRPRCSFVQYVPRVRNSRCFVGVSDMRLPRSWPLVRQRHDVRFGGMVAVRVWRPCSRRVNSWIQTRKAVCTEDRRRVISAGWWKLKQPLIRVSL